MTHIIVIFFNPNFKLGINRNYYNCVSQAEILGAWRIMKYV